MSHQQPKKKRRRSRRKRKPYLYDQEQDIAQEQELPHEPYIPFDTRKKPGICYRCGTEAATIYQYGNPIRLTLEEDGTDVDNDEILASCMGRILVVLARNEHWVDRSDFLIFQYKTPAYFGYIVNEICLENDGTTIGDADILISMSSQTVMALGKDKSWLQATDKMAEIENKVSTTSSDTPTLRYYCII
ncbi:unnamed protein product [Mytilus coruscus]|uniref:Uncharacterized protein n=1 Tax=Mytilus coruscus TaxID=42192 RepID=A0A6J8C6G7_MYTCO|nr:unnamed protein product [Mytilus coruscus]